jgi:hypothetical protein
MIEANTLSYVVDTLQAIGAIAVGVALFLAYRTYRFSASKWQFELARQIQDDVTGFTKELAIVDDKDNQAKQLLCERLFNSLEWLGFLINEKQITNNKIILYFKQLVIQYFDNTFMTTGYISQKQRDNPNEFKEFKKLYQDYKDCKYD